MYFFLIIALISLFTKKLFFIISVNFILYILTFKKKLHLNFHKFIEKYFYFLITIFISYSLLAYLKNDFYIFIEYIKSAILLTLKIFIIAHINILILNDKKLKKIIPHEINFILKIFNFSIKFIKNQTKSFSKFELIKNLDKILSDLIIGIIKASLKNET